MTLTFPATGRSVFARLSAELPPGDRVAASADVRFNGSLSTLEGYHPTSLTRELAGPGRLSGNPEVNFARAQADLNTAALRGFVRGGEGGGPTGLATTSRATSYLREWITLAADPGSPSNLSVPGEIRFHLSVGYDMGPHPTGYDFTSSSGTFALQPIPEPAVTAALLGLILPGVALFRRRSRRNQPFAA